MGFDNRYYNFNRRTSLRSHQTSFFRPYLRLELDPNDPTTFAPAHRDIKYLFLRVHNIGGGVANNCQAEVIVIPPNSNPMGFPSVNTKILAWGREHDLSDLKPTTKIRKHHWDLFHVVFAHPRFPYVRVPADTPTRYASFSTLDRLKDNEVVIPESFTLGDYEIEVHVTSDETHTMGRFRVHVDENHMALGMTALPYRRRERVKQLMRIAI